MTTRKAIIGTSDPVLYQSQQVNPYAYRFDNVPNGMYEVDLEFAELNGNIRNGKRVFDVILENTLVLPAHHIRYEVRSMTADDHTFTVEVTDARMDVRLVPRAGAESPVINALRVTHRPDR